MRRRPRTSTASLLTLLAALLLAVAPHAAAQVPGGSSDATLPDIEDEVMCPICGTLLGLSESPQANAERAFIQRRIVEGMSKQEIKDALVAEYGPEVLATPESSGFDLAAWIVPALGLLLGAMAVAIGARRWRREGRNSGGPGASAAPPPDPAAGDEARLEADLGRYNL